MTTLVHLIHASQRKGTPSLGAGRNLGFLLFNHSNRGLNQLATDRGSATRFRNLAPWPRELFGGMH